MKKIGPYAEDFKKIDVDEPSVEDSVKILNGLKKYYEDFHKVSFMKIVLMKLLIFPKNIYLI